MISGEEEPGEAAGLGRARRRLEHLGQPGPLRGVRGAGGRGAERAGAERLLQLGRHRTQRLVQRRRHRRRVERGSRAGEILT